MISATPNVITILVHDGAVACTSDENHPGADQARSFDNTAEESRAWKRKQADLERTRMAQKHQARMGRRSSRNPGR